MNELLKIDHLSCGYGDRPVLDGVSLEVHEGEVGLLAGSNECGKLKAVAYVAWTLHDVRAAHRDCFENLKAKSQEVPGGGGRSSPFSPFSMMVAVAERVEGTEFRMVNLNPDQRFGGILLQNPFDYSFTIPCNMFSCMRTDIESKGKKYGKRF